MVYACVLIAIICTLSLKAWRGKKHSTTVSVYPTSLNDSKSTSITPNTCNIQPQHPI